jgi:uncharacterized protein YndB with AHSA1/START domain
MMVDAEDLVIRKTLHVEAPVEEAFDVFTEGIAGWWPVATHSIGSGAVAGDWRVGGLVTETVDGQVHEWADVLEFDPPHNLLLSWRVTPGHPATELRLRFAAEGDGTRVELTHAGWEAFPDGGLESYAGYTSGWDGVLAHYVERAQG